jgi:hypothetical protein
VSNTGQVENGIDALEQLNDRMFRREIQGERRQTLFNQTATLAQRNDRASLG